MGQQDMVHGLAVARMSRRPGAWMPMKCDSQPTHQGSLIGAADQDAIPDAAHQHLGIVGEPAGDAVAPAAKVGQRRGQFPVMLASAGFKPRSNGAIDQPVIEIQARGLGAAAFGQHARPTGREAVGIQIGPRDQVQTGQVWW